jgi:hypothetical protein
MFRDSEFASKNGGKHNPVAEMLKLLRHSAVRPVTVLNVFFPGDLSFRIIIVIKLCAVLDSFYNRAHFFLYLRAMHFTGDSGCA